MVAAHDLTRRPPDADRPAAPAQTSRRTRASALWWVALCGLLTACGGGGGGGGGGGTTTTTTTPGYPPPPNTIAQPLPFPRTAPTADVLMRDEATDFDTVRDGFANSPEYEVGWQLISNPFTSGTDDHLADINAAAAYARGATGEGETILIQDSGILDTHREFINSDGSRKVTVETEAGYSPRGTDLYHGTYVAALAAGRRDDGVGLGLGNLNMHGVAFDANVFVRQINLSGGRPGYNPFVLSVSNPEPEDRALTELVGALVGRPEGAIINFSFGVSGGIERYDRDDVRTAFPLLASTLEQRGVDPADKQIIVWSAGNAALRTPSDGTPLRADSPELLPGLGVYFPELQPHVLAVVALDQDGTIADYSNRCGMARSFCIAAPGSNIVSALFTGNDDYGAGTDNNSGTSFAAPLVSGSLAVLRSYFRNADGTPQLGNTELVNRLLGTANCGTSANPRRHHDADNPCNGRYADSDIYGHGLVDLDAATRPVGMMMVGMPGTRGNRPLAGGFTVTGGAFGGALGDALAGVSVAGFDALGAPFFVPAAAMVTPARRRDAADTTVDIPLAAGAADITVSGGHGHAAANYDRTVIPAGRRNPVVHGRQSSGEVWSWTANLAGDTLASPTAGGVAVGAGDGHAAVGATPRLSLTVDAAGAVTAARYQTAAGWWLGYANDAGRELGLSAASAASSASPLINESFAAPYLSLVRDGPAVGKRGDRLGFALLHGAPRFDGYADTDGERGLGVVVDWRVGGHTLIDGGGGADFSLQAGVVSESDGVLGARATDAFGALAGETAFVGVQGAWVVGGGYGGGGHRHGGVVGGHGGVGDGGGWRLAASAFIGNTRADAGGGFVTGVGGVTSDAFAVTAARGGLWRRGDRLDLAVSQPLRVADGDLTLTLPAGRTRYGEVIRRRHRLALAPAGRAVRVGATYQTPAADGVVTGTVAVTRHPDHDPNADTAAIVKVSFSKSF